MQTLSLQDAISLAERAAAVAEDHIPYGSGLGAPTSFTLAWLLARSGMEGIRVASGSSGMGDHFWVETGQWRIDPTLRQFAQLNHKPLVEPVEEPGNFAATKYYAVPSTRQEAVREVSYGFRNAAETEDFVREMEAAIAL
ncbi:MULTISPECIES: hypothetical protein [unclassified Arthrobacter]|uniref:hypothetical protein n=1 Tax=unclassified Arthrobacter TaxID=235627 RepID=UPI001D144693|nr:MULTISPECIES: hypothetical protein [unclassified Arthrobacter]MCC3276708.1 hypothetical protein [Arthrobacter sp. zg-Y20]MCC3280741.1 hypothetical protein [Arthrobacter sp. zg-Y40]MCC9178489.1 hypothetical protein [Arthrobacter sp. zg-Y750]MDK1316867.1 hypothetical protein [Arthrobacter sp. zg.Y20]MDK1328112.1 hypothetical protein [Arthrobacter sp. zg-Y1143]